MWSRQSISCLVVPCNVSIWNLVNQYSITPGSNLVTDHDIHIFNNSRINFNLTLLTSFIPCFINYQTSICFFLHSLIISAIKQVHFAFLILPNMRKITGINLLLCRKETFKCLHVTILLTCSLECVLDCILVVRATFLSTFCFCLSAYLVFCIQFNNK